MGVWLVRPEMLTFKSYHIAQNLAGGEFWWMLNPQIFDRWPCMHLLLLGPTKILTDLIFTVYIVKNLSSNFCATRLLENFQGTYFLRMGPICDYLFDIDNKWFFMQLKFQGCKLIHENSIIILHHFHCMVWSIRFRLQWVST